MPEPERDCRSEHELSRLSDEQLLAYLVERREAGRSDCATQAFAILAFGHWDRVQAWVRIKVPAADVEDLTQTVMESALKSAFAGTTVGEFVSFLKVITQRRIADFFVRRERELEADPLPEENPENEGVFGATPHTGPEQDAVLIRECFGRALEDRSALHQTVIRLYGPPELGCEGLAAREAAAATERVHPGSSMSEANVHQIWKRFKTDVEDELGMGS